jgi:hypothetical protein
MSLGLMEPVQPSEEEARQAQEAGPKLARHLRTPKTVCIDVRDDDRTVESVPIPRACYALFDTWVRYRHVNYSNYP